MQEKKWPKRIGELLVAANIIDADTLTQALRVAKESNSPIGRTLMSMGKLSEQDLEAAIELQGWLREGAISTEFGVRALNLAIKKKIALEQSFDKLGWQPPKKEGPPKNELAELVLEAGIVGFEVLEAALSNCGKNHMTLGRYLVFSKAVSSQMLSSILTAQVLLRDGKITKEQAILALRATARKKQPIEDSLKECDACQVDSTKVRIGDLLTSAELISEDDKVSAIELGLLNKKPLGEVLVDSHMISQTVLDESLALQNLVLENKLNPEEAIAALKQSQAGASKACPTFELALADSEIQEANEIVDMLRQFGILSDEQLAQASTLATHKKITLCESLITAGVLKEVVISAGHIAKDLMNDEVINREQATALLSYCSQRQVEFHEALLKVPWLDEIATK